MAIDDLPLPVVTFLNVIGVPWPYLNEDTLSQYATLVREFGQAVGTTHQDASRSIAGVAQAYQSVASQRMTDGWEKLSARHVTGILDGCAVLADALDAAAVYVVAQKGEALIELIGMATAFLAAQAAAVETVGISEAAVPLIIKGAENLMASLEQDLQQYLAGKVIEAGMKPLFAKVEAAMKGLDWSQSGAADPGKGEGFELDAPTTLAHADALTGYAAEMKGHAATFASGVRGLSF